VPCRWPLFCSPRKPPGRCILSNTDTATPEVKRHAYSIREAAMALGDRSEQFVRNLIADGELAARYGKGRAVFILPTELDRYLQSLPSERR